MVVSTGRLYSTRRQAIVKSLMDLLGNINGAGDYESRDLSDRVYGTLKFFSDLTDFPAVCVVAGTEVRGYKTAGYRDRYLDVKIVIFVQEENALDTCELLLQDIESLIEENGRLAYTDRQANLQHTHDITIMSISTDEGTLEPISIGEMSLRVQY